jgi:U3 small nucleolar RNA-associated protein 22
MNNFSSEPISQVCFHRVLSGFYALSQLLRQDQSKPKGKGLVSLNEGAVLSEVGRIGEGIITIITKQT